MATTVKHLTLSALAGLVLAAGAWLCWWLASLALGATAQEQLPALGLALAIGALSAALTGGVLSLSVRRQAAQWHEKLNRADKELAAQQRILAEPLAPRQRPHPLRRSVLRARLSANLRWEKLSQALVQTLHVDAMALLGKPIFRQVHPEDVAVLDRALQEARTTRKPRQVRFRFMAAAATGSQAQPVSDDTKELPPLKPPSFHYLRLDVWAKASASGKVERYDCRFVDLTPDVIRREEALHVARKEAVRSRRRWRAVYRDLARLKLSYHELYHNAPVMYFSINAEGKLVTVNDTLLRTLGYDRAELQGHPYRDLLPPATVQDATALAKSMPSVEGEFETAWRKKDGGVFHVWIHTVPVSDEQGKFARYRSAALDLSEKNRLADELRSRGDELERMNQRLRGINRELEDFTHVVSHDLKEPLRTLEGYSRLLAEEHGAQLGPDGYQHINHLIRASHRLRVLIDELLQLSQAGRITCAPQAFNLREIVATVRQDLVDLLQRQQANLDTEGCMPDIVGDPVRITQLLTNLVANGLKYNRALVPRVVIGAQECVAEPSQVTIFVRDNGIGIDAAFHEQIFGIFRRLHKSAEYEGTGAGLAICQKIVEGHGGRIWVESQLGQGATFFFTLPRSQGKVPAPSTNGVHYLGAERKSDGPPSSAARRRSAVAAETVHAGPSPRIILVEDQSEVSFLIQKLGKRDGLAITWFATAEEAWDYLQKESADLLLLDVNLPGMSGVELCQRLRKLPHLAETPVAIFTPEQDPEPLQELRAAGADFFLSKDLLTQPVVWQKKIQELLEQIRQPLAP